MGKQKYNINHNLFNSIDTEAKAYFAGLIAADGYITKTNSVGIQLIHTDKEILEQCRDSLFPDVDLKYYDYSKYKSKYSFNKAPVYRLIVTSSNIINDLQIIGITKNKSLTMPSICNKIPLDFRHHFIRGYFDGDGCVCKSEYFCKVRQHIKKTYKVELLGTEEFLLDMHKEINIPVGTVRLKHGSKIHKLAYYGKCRLSEFSNYIYQDATIYLTRKYNRFQDYLISG